MFLLLIFFYISDQNLKDEEERQELESINEKLMIELDDLKEEADTMLSTLEDRKKETRKLKDTLVKKREICLHAHIKN